MLEFSTIQQITIWAIPVLLAITLHEAAHALAANACGDTTAKALGRLSINPFRHIDLIGTIILPLAIGFLTQFQFIFGYAKPVPVNWSRLRRPRLDVALVSFAGPLSNLIQAFFWALVFKLSLMINPFASNASLFLTLTARAGILVNLILGILNLIPLPPLDGSRIVAAALPPRYGAAYLRIEPYGFFILVLLLITGILGMVMSPLLDGSLNLIRSLFRL